MIIFKISNSCNIIVFKIITNENDTVYVYNSDIYALDTIENIVYFKNYVLSQIKMVKKNINIFYFFNEHGEWEVVEIVGIRTSYLPSKYIYENEVGILFYHDNGIKFYGLNFSFLKFEN